MQQTPHDPPEILPAAQLGERVGNVVRLVTHGPGAESIEWTGVLAAVGVATLPAGPGRVSLYLEGGPGLRVTPDHSVTDLGDLNQYRDAARLAELGDTPGDRSEPAAGSFPSDLFGAVLDPDVSAARAQPYCCARCGYLIREAPTAPDPVCPGCQRIDTFSRCPHHHLDQLADVLDLMRPRTAAATEGRT